jgi:hypothetical protein
VIGVSTRRGDDPSLGALPYHAAPYHAALKSANAAASSPVREACQVRHGRGRTLADRVVVERCVRRDPTSGRRVGHTRDGVNHQLTVSVHRDLDASLRARLDQLVDGLLDLLLDVGHHCFLSRLRSPV